MKALTAASLARIGAATALLAANLAAVSTKASAADLARGEQLFHTCAACHSVLGDGIGPDITGIYGQPAAMRAGFNYSNALKHRGLTWTEANLRAFIHDPQAFVPGTLMSFPGYERTADIDDVLGYLKSLK
jgi:cytochrome c2